MDAMRQVLTRKVIGGLSLLVLIAGVSTLVYSLIGITLAAATPPTGADETTLIGLSTRLSCQQMRTAKRQLTRHSAD